MTDLGPLRGNALIPRVDGVYTGAVKIHGYIYVAVIAREGDGVRLKIYDGPYVPPTAEQEAEHEAWLVRNSRTVTG